MKLRVARLAYVKMDCIDGRALENVIILFDGGLRNERLVKLVQLEQVADAPWQNFSIGHALRFFLILQTLQTDNFHDTEKRYEGKRRETFI